jgi:Trk K+ transport system NAD-binding subunit
MLVAGRLLLPARRGGEGAVDRFRLDDYFTELTILPDSHFLEKTIDEVEADKRYKLKVVGWLREGRRMRRPFKDQLLGAGDALLIRTRPEDILAIRQEPGVELRAFMEQGEQGAEAPSPGGDEEEITDVLAQAVVAPGSDHAGREIGEIDFRRRYGVVVLGLWRKEGWLDRELAKITLHPGDVLALQGDEESLARVERDPAFLRGKAHVIVVVAEGAEYNAEKLTRYFKRRRERLGFDLRVTTLGHVQRGGAPGAFDRLLATRFGAAATERLGRGEHGVLVGLIKGEIAATPLDEVVTNRKRLEPGLFELARALAK